jgi:hypothetical protein
MPKCQNAKMRKCKIDKMPKHQSDKMPMPVPAPVLVPHQYTMQNKGATSDISLAPTFFLTQGESRLALPATSVHACVRACAFLFTFQYLATPSKPLPPLVEVRARLRLHLRLSLQGTGRRQDV